MERNLVPQDLCKELRKIGMPLKVKTNDFTEEELKMFEDIYLRPSFEEVFSWLEEQEIYCYIYNSLVCNFNKQCTYQIRSKSYNEDSRNVFSNRRDASIQCLISLLGSSIFKKSVYDQMKEILNEYNAPSGTYELEYRGKSVSFNNKVYFNTEPLLLTEFATFFYNFFKSNEAENSRNFPTLGECSEAIGKLISNGELKVIKNG